MGRVAWRREWVRAKIFKARVTGGGEGYVGLDRLGGCKERPRLAARACAQQQLFTTRFRGLAATPIDKLRREEEDPIRSDRVRGRREIRSRESFFLASSVNSRG